MSSTRLKFQAQDTIIACLIALANTIQLEDKNPALAQAVREEMERLKKRWGVQQ